MKLRIIPSIYFVSLYLSGSSAHYSAEEIKDQSNKWDQIREESARIVGGVNSPMGAYPWFARFTTEVTCGGSLISKEYVLTAAHCVDRSKAKLEAWGSLQIGALCYPYFQGHNCGQFVETIGIRKIFVHPKYDETSYLNDVALIRLDTESRVAPVAIDQTGISTFYTDEQSLYAVGLGKLDHGDDVSDLPVYLQHTEVSHFPNDICEDNYAKVSKAIDERSMFCASGSGRDSCHGDSGGPLYDLGSEKVSGIISWGKDCANPEYPGVYTRISGVFPWIQKRVCNKSLQRNLPAWCEEKFQDRVAAHREECDGDFFSLDFQNDNIDKTLRFVVKRRNGKGKFRQRVLKGNVVGANKYKSRSVCVKRDECYQMVVIDRGSGNGLCCSNGTGFYRIKKNGEQIIGSRMKNKRKKLETFGSSC